ncbi:MAG: hypothetical protein WCK09_07690 [Bacteroidota bacterium]
MTARERLSTFLIIGFIFLMSIPIQAQFVTIARKIKSMRTPETDIATVIIDAKTYRVYRAVIDTLTSNPKFTINSMDDAKRFVEFTTGPNKVSMQIDSLAIDLSQITVASKHSENSAKQSSSIAVEAVLRVCDKLGVKCTLDK